jgi:hypothetical protein
MGNNISFQFPNENKYCCSNEKKYNVIQGTIIKESIDLSKFISNNDNFIYQIIFYQINSLGYSINLKPPIISPYSKNNTIKERIDLIEKIGFISSDYRDILSDLIFTTKCYFPTLENIKSLLSEGNILLAGIILDPLLVKSISSNEFNKKICDVVCIVGYNFESLFIKCTWTQEIINLDYNFLDNFQEIWTIIIESPENKIISKINTI